MMLAPLYDDLESATMVAQWSREALSRIREKMMAQQKGEAFYSIAEGSLEIPSFLRRHKDDPPDTTPMPEWILKANAAAATRKVGSSKREITPQEQAIVAAAEAEYALLTSGKKAAKKEQQENQKEAAEKRARAKARVSKAEPAEVVEQEWDSGSGCWRPVGYMSRSKYRRLLAGMPTDEHREVFVKMYGHTQKPEDREPSNRSLAAIRRHAHETLRPASKAAAPVKDTTKKVTAPAGATAGRERKLNPEHDAKVSAMLLRPEGVTLGEIGSAMGWQEHSASAFLSGIRKTRTIVKTVEARGNVYRLEKKS